MRSRLRCWTERPSPSRSHVIWSARLLPSGRLGRSFILSQQQSCPLNMPAVARLHFPTPPSLSISDIFEARICCVIPPSISALSCSHNMPAEVTNQRKRSSLDATDAAVSSGGDHRKRRRNRTMQSCINCHTSKRMVCFQR